MSELDGFTVYKPGTEKAYFIKANEKAVTVCKEAWEMLGRSEYVNVFLDEMHGRIMIKPAERDFDNIMRCSKPHEGHHTAAICCHGLAMKVLKMMGNKRIYGHPVSGGMIFENEDRSDRC